MGTESRDENPFCLGPPNQLGFPEKRLKTNLPSYRPLPRQVEDARFLRESGEGQGQVSLNSQKHPELSYASGGGGLWKRKRQTIAMPPQRVNQGKQGLSSNQSPVISNFTNKDPQPPPPQPNSALAFSKECIQNLQSTEQLLMGKGAHSIRVPSPLGQISSPPSSKVFSTLKRR